MSAIEIPCPKCGSQLKLPDRSLLGRKGRCPSCRHKFVLAEQAEVELQLADSPAEGSPREGTSPRWVPDEEEGADFDGVETDREPVLEDGKDTSGDVSRRDVKSRIPRGSRNRRSRRSSRSSRGGRRGQQSRLPMILAGSGLGLLAIVGGILAAMSGFSSKEEATAEKDGSDRGVAVVDSGDPTLPAETKTQTGDSSLRQSIELKMVPAGANIILHLHPSELWTEGSLGEEVRFCLGPLGEWAEKQLVELCRFAPGEIEEALICLMLGERGTPPETAVVFTLKEKQQPSALLEKFPGKRSEDYVYPVYLDEKYCYLRSRDARTIAVGPVGRADEMASAVRQSQVTATGIEQLLTLTDREKTFTLIFEPRDARNFQDVLVGDNVAPFYNLVLDWFDDEEIETVAWSLSLDQRRDRFESEILLRNHHSQRNLVTPARLERRVQKRLGSLVEEVHQAVLKMKPGVIGPFRIIGRFPALVSAFVLETKTAVGDRHVQLLTRLPERAAPNLLLGTLLAWDESTRTDFSTATVPSAPVAAKKKLPATVLDGLNRKIEVDFNRTPLQDAMNFISEEMQVAIVIDGDALKLSGFTKNMPQTMSHTDQPAKFVIHQIIKQYDKMVIVVDDAKKQVLLTTLPATKAQGLKPFPVTP